MDIQTLSLDDLLAHGELVAARIEELQAQEFEAVRKKAAALGYELVEQEVKPQRRKRRTKAEMEASRNEHAQ